MRQTEATWKAASVGRRAGRATSDGVQLQYTHRVRVAAVSSPGAAAHAPGAQCRLVYRSRFAFAAPNPAGTSAAGADAAEAVVSHRLR